MISVDGKQTKTIERVFMGKTFRALVEDKSLTRLDRMRAFRTDNRNRGFKSQFDKVAIERRFKMTLRADNQNEVIS